MSPVDATNTSVHQTTIKPGRGWQWTARRPNPNSNTGYLHSMDMLNKTTQKRLCNNCLSVGLKKRKQGCVACIDVPTYSSTTTKSKPLPGIRISRWKHDAINEKELIQDMDWYEMHHEGLSAWERSGFYHFEREEEEEEYEENVENQGQEEDYMEVQDDTNTSISISEERNLNVDIDPLKVEQVAEQVDTDSEWEEVLLPPTPKMSYASVLKENQIFE